MVALVTELGDPEDTGLVSEALNGVARAGIVEVPGRRFVNQRGDDLLGVGTDGSRRNNQRYKTQGRRYHGRGQESSGSSHGDEHFNVEQRPYLTVANGSAPQQADAEPDETVTFIATGSDTDGGVKTIEIWHTTNNCSLGDPDDEDQATACQPLLAPSIAAKNPDPDIMKTAGATAAKSRTVSYNVHFPLDSTRSFKKDVWAKVVNWAGDEVQSAHITIDGRT